MFKIVSSGILLGILISLPLSAGSQTNVYVGPHLGIQNSSGSESANYLIGATVRVRLMPILGAEADIGYRQEKYGDGAVTARDWPVTVTGLLYPLPFIYGGVGGGWYFTTFDYADAYNDAGFEDETTQNFGWHLAAGVEVPASPRFRVFGDIRFVFLEYDFADLPGEILDGADSDFYSINVGVLFRL